MAKAANRAVIPPFSRVQEITTGTQWLGFDRDGKTLHGIQFLSDSSSQIELKKMNIFTSCVKCFPISIPDLPVYQEKQWSPTKACISLDGQFIGFIESMAFCRISTENQQMKVYDLMYNFRVIGLEFNAKPWCLMCGSNGDWFVKFVKHTGDTYLYCRLVLDEEYNVAHMGYVAKRSVPTEAWAHNLDYASPCDMFFDDKFIAFDRIKLDGFLCAISIFNFADNSCTTHTSGPQDFVIKKDEHFKIVGTSMDTMIFISINSGLLLKYDPFTNTWFDMKLVLKTEDDFRKNCCEIHNVLLAIRNILCRVVHDGFDPPNLPVAAWKSGVCHLHSFIVTTFLV